MKVEVDALRVRFGEVAAVAGVSLAIESGELVALLGPSGSGKTTLLRAIAGLATPEAGRVRFGGDDVTGTPVRERGVGFVFQDYALFEHMTVEDNVAFGLAVRKTDKRRIAERVAELLSRVQLDGFGSRMPRELSGGQRQRVALARALAPEPRLLLLDEPFGALDARVRAELRGWLRRLHDELRVTSVFVTHDQDEALEVADRVVVMNAGRVEQAGTPDELFDTPATAFVMEFLGGTNTLAGGRVAGAVARFGALELPATGHADGPARAFVRSHDLVLARDPNGASMPVTVAHVRRVGVAARVVVTHPDHGELVAELPARDVSALGVERGARLHAHVRSARIFPESS